MRKELNNLTINDVVYFAKKDSTQYAHCKLVSINKKYCLFTHQYDIKDNYGVKILTRYEKDKEQDLTTGRQPGAYGLENVTQG